MTMATGMLTDAYERRRDCERALAALMACRQYLHAAQAPQALKYARRCYKSVQGAVNHARARERAAERAAKVPA
jgi:hypothetical protein